MSLAVVLVLVLSVAVAFAGIVGTRTNRRLAAGISELLEAALHPIDKDYTNIGGLVGYHFQYDTGEAFGKINGTMTFLPRQTILYLPFSLLAGRQDRLSIVFHPAASPPGNGHIIDAHQHRAGWFHVDGEEDMERIPVSHGGREFIVLAYNPRVRDRLLDALRRVPDASSLRHFGYSGGSDCTYVVELRPRLATLSSTVEYFASFVSEFSRSSL